MELTLVHNDERFCPVYKTQKGNPAIDARELHKTLGIKTRFNDWISREIEAHVFIENVDFRKINEILKNEYSQSSSKRYSGLNRGTVRTKYLLRINTAKHIAMATMTERGKQVRDYFIRCEQGLKEVVAGIASTPDDIIRMTAPTEQKRANKRVAAVIFNGNQKNIPNLQIHNRRVCKTLTGKEPKPYAKEVSEYLHRTMKSGRDAMRAVRPELASTVAVCDLMVSEGQSMDEIERSGLLKELPSVFKKIMLLNGTYRPMLPKAV